MNNLHPHISGWTTTKSSILVTIFPEDDESETPESQDITMISGKTCIFRGNIEPDHPAVAEAKTQLNKWAEDFRRMLGAATFQNAMHPEYAPQFNFISANQPTNESQNAVLSITAIFRKCMTRVTITTFEEETKKIEYEMKV